MEERSRRKGTKNACEGMPKDKKEVENLTEGNIRSTERDRCGCERQELKVRE